MEGKRPTNAEAFMRDALAEAGLAEAEGEVPIGCVVVRDGRVVGRGHNRTESSRSALSHAELEAIKDACENLGGWRLWDCDLYVTLEPCPMCAGAIVNARVRTVYYGAKDPKYGSCGSVVDLFALPYSYRPTAVGGILEQECADKISSFFRELRRGGVKSPNSSNHAETASHKK